jgi:hypothetical protein
MPLLQSSSPCQRKQFQLHAVGIFKLNSYRQLLCIDMELPSQQRKVPKEEKEIKQAQLLFPAPVETCKAKERFVAYKASKLAWKIATSYFLAVSIFSIFIFFRECVISIHLQNFP